MLTVKPSRLGGKDARSQHVQVFVRVRPLNEQEVAHRSQTAVILKGPKEVVVNDHTTPKLAKTYAFDGVFGPNIKQVDIYHRVVGQTVADVLAGFNYTIFAYGQTGSGKTYTIEGDISGGDQGTQAGIIPRAISALFDELRLQKAEFTVRISFVELYNEELYDLFSPDEVPPKLRLFDDPAKKGSVIIQSLEELLVHSKSQALEILKKGLAKRQVAATQMNAQSSRSHTVFCATVHTKENNLDGEELVKFGKLYLVDLAGSENIGRSGSSDKRAREAGSINQSLLTLGRVISCLVERQPHVPYRESKLTRILQDSLGGRTKTTIIATVSPTASNVEETLSTLDYALKAKSVSNKPEVNQKVSKEAVMKEYAVLIEDLKKKLNLTREGTGIYIATENYQSVVEQLEARNKDLVEKIAEIRVCVNEMKRYERLFEDLSNQVSSREQQLEEVQRDLGETKECVHKSKAELEAECEKLAETTELVEKADHYENGIYGQAANLISIVEECQDDSVQLHSKLDNSRSIQQRNIQYASTLIKEVERLNERLTGKMNEFHGATASLSALCCKLRTLKDNGDEDLKLLKSYAFCTRDRFVSTIKKISAVIEDQENYKKQWDSEILAESNERCEQQVKNFALLLDEMSSCFESYRNLTNTIGTLKGTIPQTIYKVQNEWLNVLDQVSTASEDGFREAVDHYIRGIDQGKEILGKVVTSANDFCQQEQKFDKERSEAIDEVLQAIGKLENLLNEQNSRGVCALAEMEKVVKDAADYWEVFEPNVLAKVGAVQEHTQRAVLDYTFGATSLKQAVSKHTKELISKVMSMEGALVQTELTCEEICSNNSSTYSALVSDTDAALEDREKESKDTLMIEEVCLEELRKELLDLDRKYAEKAKKIQDRYEKITAESEQCVDRFTDVSRDFRSDLKDHLETQLTLVRTFVQDQFKRDCPTGETPPRKNMRIPPLDEPLASPDVRRIVRKVDDDWDNDFYG